MHRLWSSLRFNFPRAWYRIWLGGLLAFTLTAATPPLLGSVVAQEVKPAAVAVDTYPVSTEDLDQTWPAAAFNAATGEYLVAYEHDFSTGDNDFDIHARRINRDGSPVAATFTVVQTGSQELRPDIAVNTINGEYLVVWEHVVSSSDHDIRAIRVSSGGSLVGSDFAIATTATLDAYPAVAYNATNDEYLVVWQRPGIDTNDITGRRVDADGTLLGATTIGIGVAGSGGTLPYQPDVAWDSVNNQYLVVWGKYTGSEYDIAGQIVDYDGSKVGSALTVENWEYNQLKPKVAYNPHWDEFLVVWEDHKWGWGNDSDIYARRVDYDGDMLGDHFGVGWGPEDTKQRINPVIAYKPYAREYMVSWEHVHSATDHDIYRRRLDAGGALLENEQIVVNTGNTEQSPTLAADDADRYLVAWSDGRNTSTTEMDIYAALPPTDQFSGHVYDGTSWESAAPLPGAIVALYCSNSADNLGTLLQTDTTDAQGGYALGVVRNCEYWHLVETDPTGYQSVASRTTGGTVVSVNYIRYSYPLTGKVFSGNDFLDTPQTPEDGLAPGNWANFAPPGWVTQQSVTAMIQVEDTGTGLNVASAEYAYSTDGGATWRDWRGAICSGGDGTTTPQTITAENVPFGQDSAVGGQNRIKFRIRDMQSNLGTSGVYSVAIDSAAPPKPTGLNSTSHQTSVWSKDNTVDAVWNAVTDGGSGLAGYSVEWSKASNTTPDTFADATTPAMTSSALENTDLWYLHVRAVDNAGNLSATAHLGPFYIDTLAPYTSVGFLDQYQGSLSFTVTWSEATTYGSPFAGYDIKVVDTWDGGSNTTTWKSNTPQTSATFTGVRGHTYAFYSRGRDAAGNQEAYPGSPDVTTTVGKDMTVTVVNEANQRIYNAQTFLNGEFVGGTNTNGEWIAQDVLMGDQIAARQHLYTKTANKPDHQFLGFSGANWSWNVYITSVGFNAAGDPQLFQVANLNQSPTLTLRKSQALIGFHVLVSVEWDASAAYLADLKEGLEGASTYLYDISDGQMLFETIEITDNKVRWGPGDIRIHATNQVWPNASIDGINQGTDKHIYMGRFFDGATSNVGEWKYSDGFRTFIHEFGHYGLAMYDEYLDRDGDKTSDAYCATNFSTTPVERRASFMYYQYTATEMCSRVDPNHTHRTNTLHDEEYGQCLWETVVDRHKDAGNRWLIRTPGDRGAIMPGPNAIAVADWTNVFVTDAGTGVCAPYVANVNLAGLPSWMPLGDPKVWVDRACSYCPDIEQGKTDKSGNITILGAHNGDTLRVSIPLLLPIPPFGLSVASAIQCSTEAGIAATAAVTPQPDAFGITVTVTPGTAGQALVKVQPSVALAQAPIVEFVQTGADAALPIAMSLPAGQTVWQGTAALQPGREPAGYVFVVAEDTHDHIVWRRQEFAFTAVAAGELVSEIYSADGVARLVVRPDTLPHDAMLSIQTATGGDPLDQVQVGAAYAFVAAGVGALRDDATIHMTYPAEQSAGVLSASLSLYRWNDQTHAWVKQSSTHDTVLHLVSAHVSQLGVYAILGEPSAEGRLNLPWAARNPVTGVSQTAQVGERQWLFLPDAFCAEPAGAPAAGSPLGAVVDAHRDLPHNTLYLPFLR
jgi:hypothetical protein